MPIGAQKKPAQTARAIRRRRRAQGSFPLFYDISLPGLLNFAENVRAIDSGAGKARPGRRIEQGEYTERPASTPCAENDIHPHMNIRNVEYNADYTKKALFCTLLVICAARPPVGRFISSSQADVPSSGQKHRETGAAIGRRFESAHARKKPRAQARGGGGHGLSGGADCHTERIAPPRSRISRISAGFTCSGRQPCFTDRAAPIPAASPTAKQVPITRHEP